MKYADESGALTWDQLGWTNPAATRRVGAAWVDAHGFSTAEESAEWLRLLDEERSQKAHEDFVRSVGGGS